LRILIASGDRRVREAGAAGVVFHHADELQKLGHKVDVWFFDDVIPSPRWPTRFRSLEFATALSRRILSNPAQFEVVNIHAPFGCVYGLARKSSSKPTPPYVFTMQGSEERYVSTMRREHHKGRATNFGWKNRVWHRLYHQNMYNYSISTADFGNVANREGWIMSELKYGHPSGRIWYVPNGTTAEFFRPRTFSDGPAKKLLYVGTWLDRKGIHYMVDAFCALAVRDQHLRLTIAGCLVSDEHVKADFPQSLRDRLNIVPFLRRAEMPDLYSSHDIFVFPSLMEGMPLTLIEAMATAMPVVTTNTCGMADVVENNRNGLLVPAADTPQLAAALEDLIASGELRERLGTAAQATATQYTWDKIVPQLEHILQLAIRSRRARRAK
jgi:glycosyltransferase involved in cell wall biosynthesis